MRPDESDLNEEIRGHLAIDIKERIDRGEDPVSARRAALMEFGYVPAVRDEMRRVWYSRWYDQAEALARDIRFALRSLTRARAADRHGGGDAGVGHRRQRGDLQCRSERAAPSARQSRRGSADLYPPDCPGHRDRQPHLLGSGNQ